MYRLETSMLLVTNGKICENPSRYNLNMYLDSIGGSYIRDMVCLACSKCDHYCDESHDSTFTYTPENRNIVCLDWRLLCY